MREHWLESKRQRLTMHPYSRSEELKKMSAEPNSACEYHLGGSLPVNAPTYVRQQADYWRTTSNP